MGQWYVQRGREVELLEEDTLRERLRSADLSGTELARPDHSEEWAPLSDYDVFAQEVPHVGDASTAAAQRQMLGWAAHAGLFVVVVSILHFNSWVTGLWGLAVAGHLLRSLPAAARVLQLRRRQREPVRRRPRTMSAEHQVLHDPFVEELGQALGELERAIDGAPGELADPPELERIRLAAMDAHDKRLALLDLVDTRLQRKLETDLDQLRTDIQNAPDPRTAETYEAEAHAIGERLAAARVAFAAADRLRSRERTLLHQLQGARLDLLRANIGDEPVAPGLAAKLERYRGDLEAEAEVEDELARARQATNRAEF